MLISSENLRMNPSTPKSDKHLISPHNISPEFHIKVTRIKEMITTKEALECETNSPCQHLKKCMMNSSENIHTDIRV